MFECTTHGSWRGRVLALAVPALFAGCFSPGHIQPTRIAEEESEFVFDLTIREIDFEFAGEASILQPLGLGLGLSASADDDQLNLDDHKFTSPRLDLWWDNKHLTVSSVRTGHAGLGTADVIVVPPTVISTSISTDFEIASDNLALTWDLASSKEVEAGVGVGLSHIGIDVDITSISVSTVSVDEDEEGYIPTLAFRFGWLKEPLNVELLYQWLKDYTDVELVLRYEFLRYAEDKKPAAYLSAGYKSIGVDTDWDSNGYDLDIDVEFKGPWVGLSVPF